MIRLHLNPDDFSHIQNAEFQPHMQASNTSGIAFSTTPWHWYGLRKVIFDKQVWLFIEAESQFCLCFFDLKPRDLKQLDLTLWLRFISEQNFMARQRYLGAYLPINEQFLSLIRSLMAPLHLEQGMSDKIERYAHRIFDQITSYLQRPLPMPIPLQYEMEFDWQLNTTPKPTFNCGTLVKKTDLDDLDSQSQAMVIDFPIDGIDFKNLPIDEITMMELIHQQLSSGHQNSPCPALIFTSKIASMLNNTVANKGQLLPFKPTHQR